MEPSIRKANFHKNDDWVVYSIQGRLDSFNFKECQDEVESQIQSGAQKLALDLSRTDFLNLSGIRYFSDLAQKLTVKGGDFVLCAPSEKIKRQISIFASLKGMRICRSINEL